MKKLGIMTAIVLINFILQTSLYNFMNIYGVIPNISLIVLVIFSIGTNSIIGGFFGIIIGLLYDLVLYDIFGIYTLIYFVIGFIVGSFSEEVNKENYIVYIVFTFASSVIMEIFIFLILFFLRFNVVNTYYILEKIAIQIFLNTVFSFIILKIIVYVFKQFNIKLFNK